MTPVMSFWPIVFNKIISGEKLIEYRRRFPKNCTMAYMYVTKPKKAICGIIYFEKLHKLTDWETTYSNDPQTLKRILKYKQKYNYAMEIKAIQQIKPISLNLLRQNIDNFVAPQSYILLENNKDLKNFLSSNTIPIGAPIKNNLNNIFPEHICKDFL